MKEIKSKKTGKIQTLSEDEFRQLSKNTELLKRFTVTDISIRRPVLNPEVNPVELKTKKKKNDG
jgi:hypothetical protein